MGGALAVVVIIVLLILNGAFSSGRPFSEGDSSDRLSPGEETPIELEETPVFVARTISGLGAMDNSPILLELNIDETGQVNGTYWNCMLALPFDVTGQERPDGLDLTLDHNGSQTSMSLDTSDGVSYSGHAGKMYKRVQIDLQEGSLAAEAPEYSTLTLTGNVSGDGVNANFTLTATEDGKGWFWYDDVGYTGRLRVMDTANNIGLYNNGYKLAVIELSTDELPFSGVLRLNNGETYSVTNVYPELQHAR